MVTLVCTVGGGDRRLVISQTNETYRDLWGGRSHSPQDELQHHIFTV